MSFIGSGIGTSYIPLGEIMHTHGSPVGAYRRATPKYTFRAGGSYTADGAHFTVRVLSVDRSRRCPRCVVEFLGTLYPCDIRRVESSEVVTFDDARGYCYVVRAGGWDK